MRRSVKSLNVYKVHLLNDETRGATMEAVVSRMKTIVNSSPSNATLRFVAVSATVPNVEDVRLMLYSL